MVLKELVESFKQRKRMMKEAENSDFVNRRVSEKKKSANERELEKYLEEDRQKRIKKSLDGYRKRQQHEYYHKDVISQKYIFKDKNKMLNQPSIMKQKNLFAAGGIRR